MNIAIDGRCYFRTEDGGQGLCYPSAQVGDEVWIVSGSNVPFILRRADLSDEEKSELQPREAYEVGFYGVSWHQDKLRGRETEHGHYSLVGDCYYDGYMHGEGAQDLTHPIVLV
jgi:hypothetical protein